MEGPAIHFGLEVVGAELDRQIRINSELMEKNQELEQRIVQLEKIISSYQNNPSGTNNVVLL